MKQEKISFLAAVLMSVNVIVGVGIYFGPQIMAEKAGSLSFLGWGLAGLFLFPVIWCIALAARMFPGTGGFYNYCKNGISETFGFIASWAYMLGFLATAATQSTVLKEVLHRELGLTFIAHHPVLYNIGFIALVAFLNLASLSIISRIQSIATLLKLTPLFLVVLMIPFYWNSAITYSFSDLGALGFTVPMAIFGYWGFESCCNISHLIEGGSTKAFGVILTAFIMSMLLYTFFHLGIIHIMGTENLVSAGVSAFPDFMGIKSAAILQGLKVLLIAVLILNYANAVYGVMLYNITSLATMANQRFIFFSSWIEKTNAFNRPTGAVLVTSGIVLFYMTCLPNKEITLAIANMGIITALFLTLISVFRVQLQKNVSKFQLALTLLGFISCSALTYFSWQSIGKDNVARFIYTLPLIAGVVAGLFMYKQQKQCHQQKQESCQDNC